MKKLLVLLLALILILAFGTSCSPTPAATGTPTTSSTAGPTLQVSTSPAANNDPLVIYAPASTSSIPVILAAAKMQNVDLQLYTNQSQANTLFLRGDADILVTGLSVGVDLYKNQIPLQAVNSFVSGLSYLVTYGKPVVSLADLRGESIYVPFEGSPIEEVTAFLAEKEGFIWKTDYSPVYSPFESSVELLKQGTAKAVILPEPFVTLVEGQPDVFISLSLFDEWNSCTGNTSGYPQVASFVNTDWASLHSDRIEEFNRALAKAIAYTEGNPDDAVKEVASHYKLPAEKLIKSLSRTRYNLVSGKELQTVIENYYQTIGKPLDENFSGFYYLPAE